MDTNSLAASLAEIFDQLVFAWEWKSFLGLLVGIVSFLFGVDLFIPITAMCVLIILDFILGSIVAYSHGTYSSGKAMKTAYKILIYGALIVAAHMYDVIVNFDNVFGITMIGFLASNEFISIMRNANRLGYQTPKKLVDTISETVRNSAYDSKGRVPSKLRRNSR